MNSRHLVDPELLEFLDRSPLELLDAENLPRRRSAHSLLRQTQAAGIGEGDDVDCREYRISLPGAPAVRVLRYRPVKGDGLLAAVLDIHGGGYVMGSADMNAPYNRRLAAQLGCVVVSVDYRLAPETPYPGALEDCYAALNWLQTEASSLQIDPQRIAVVGGSAGGGLAAALALLARDRGEVRIAYLQLISPMLDDRPPAEPHPYTGEFIWRRGDNTFGWTSLLGKTPGGADVPAYAAAARADRLAGLPPTYISVGTLDLFLEQNLEYARRLTCAGVPVELHLYPGAYHGFFIAAPDSQLAHRHARDCLDGLRRAL